VVVAAAAGSASAAQAFAVTILNRNEGIVITSDGGDGSAGLTIDEGAGQVTTVIAYDPDGTTPVYSITGGADSSLFAVDSETGVLSFVGTPDYETPLDAGADNFYDVIVTATDGELSSSQILSVMVRNVNEGVTITSGGGADSVSVTIDENQPAVASVSAVDGDGTPVFYSIAGGADAALFAIDPLSGELRFTEGADYDSPGDSDGDNVYEVIVAADDGLLSDTQAFSISIADVDEPLFFTSYASDFNVSLAVDENGLDAATVAAEDPEGGAIVYSIVDSFDGASFTIDAQTGVIRFVTAPDHESPADLDGDNVYTVLVSATDGNSFDYQTISIQVGDVNEGVTITSPAALSVEENGTAVSTLLADDADGDAVSYAISGGADASFFTIDAQTGALAFVQAPDFEAPGDSDGDNVYQVTVSASDGMLSDSKALSISVLNRNEGISITSNGGGTSVSLSRNEGSRDVTTVVASDPDGTSPVYSILGGPDAALFAIDSATGALTFIDAPDYEAPHGQSGPNLYTVEVGASDGEFTSRQTIQIAVGNVNEGVTITSAADHLIPENGNAVTTIAASDVDGDTLIYAVAGGADAAFFAIDAQTGALRFVAAPNYEAPADAGGNNVYNVTVSATDGSFTATKTLAISVGNVNEAVAIVSNGGGASASIALAENGTLVTVAMAADPDGGAVTYAIAGGADAAKFTINAATGYLAFITAPNFEAPSDAGANNVYDVVISASDGSFIDTQALSVSVGNVNEALAITSNGGGASASIAVAENVAGVTIVAAADPEGAAPTYSIVGGADAARFTINAQTGALQFVAAPDWELPADSNQDNVYAVVVRASDGLFVDDQTLSVTVTNARDGNNVTGTSGGDAISATSTNVALRTSSEEDVVFGRDGNDNIQGMAGDDELYGEAGNDVLVGGDGADRLTGGLGKDQFTYNAVSESSPASRDLILDFSRAQADKISLSGIDANSVLSGNQAFTFIGAAAFSHSAGQLRFDIAGGITTISADVNGDGIADLQIQLSGSITVIASDFVL
jgi:hypothetical protein